MKCIIIYFIFGFLVFVYLFIYNIIVWNLFIIEFLDFLFICLLQHT